MPLREDSEPYCLLWIGLLLLGAYYANFGYILWTYPSAAVDFFSSANFVYMLLLLMFPPLMAFLFTGYLRPSRGKAKMSMLGPSVIAALFFVIVSHLVSMNSDILGNLIFFSGWGIGSSLLVAGGLSIMQTLQQSTSSGKLDVQSLHYGLSKLEPESVVEEIPTSSTDHIHDPDSEVE